MWQADWGEMSITEHYWALRRKYPELREIFRHGPRSAPGQPHTSSIVSGIIIKFQITSYQEVSRGEICVWLDLTLHWGLGRRSLSLQSLIYFKWRYLVNDRNIGSPGRGDNEAVQWPSDVTRLRKYKWWDDVWWSVSRQENGFQAWYEEKNNVSPEPGLLGCLHLRLIPPI